MRSKRLQFRYNLTSTNQIIIKFCRYNWKILNNVINNLFSWNNKPENYQRVEAWFIQKVQLSRTFGVSLSPVNFFIEQMDRTRCSASVWFFCHTNFNNPMHPKPLMVEFRQFLPYCTPRTVIMLSWVWMTHRPGLINLFVSYIQ